MSMMLIAMLVWRELPALPQALGGQFVGEIGNRLVVVGGTYWTGTPWTGGTKHWVDTVYTLGRKDQKWSIAGRLPEALAYGAAVSVPGAMLLIGGQSDRETHGKVWRLTLDTGEPKIEALPSLPCACGWMSAAVLNDAVYVAAGGEGWPAPVKALRRFWKLDLRNPAAGWSELKAWPGSARFFAMMSADGDSLYLAGGADLSDGKRTFLKDVYRFKPGEGWSRAADLPFPLQAGFSAVTPQGRLIVLGGNDGEWADRESDPKHPGFRREVLEYDSTGDRWREVSRMPASLVTSGLAMWDGGIVIAGGEDRPGSRSARVIAGRLTSK